MCGVALVLVLEVLNQGAVTEVAAISVGSKGTGQIVAAVHTHTFLVGVRDALVVLADLDNFIVLELDGSAGDLVIGDKFAAMTVEQRVASANIVIAGESEHVRIAVGVATVGPAGQVAVAVIAPGVSTHGLVAAVHNGHLGVTVTAAAAGQVDDAGNFVLAVVFPELGNAAQAVPLFGSPVAVQVPAAIVAVNGDLGKEIGRASCRERV